MKKEEKKVNKFLRRKFKGEGHDELRLSLVKSYSDKVDMIEEYKKMKSWCTTKHKQASMLRFNNWIKNSVKFKAERSGPNVETVDDWEEGVKKTKEMLKDLDERNVNRKK